jgi:uncharacterized protein YoxC
MLTTEDLQKRMQDLSTRHAKVLRRKAELSGELKSKKEELLALVKEIQDAGYNPKTLVEERNRAQTELESLLDTFETNLVGAEKTLDEFDHK